MKYAAERKSQLVHPITRMAYLFGCCTKAELRDLLMLNPNTADKEFYLINQINNFDDEPADRLVLRSSWLEGRNARLLQAYLNQAPTSNDYAFLARFIHITAYLARHGQANFYDLRTKSAAMDPTQGPALRTFLKRLEDLGLIQRCGKDKGGIVYCLAAPFWDELTEPERLRLQHFVEWATLGHWPTLDGYTLLAKLEQLNRQPRRLFLSSSSAHALLDEDILYRLQPFIGREWIEVDVLLRDKSNPSFLENITATQTSVVFPCRILHESEYGRSYLLCFAKSGPDAPPQLLQLSASLLTACRPLKDKDQLPPPFQWEQQCAQALEHVFLAGTAQQQEPLAFTVRFAPEAVSRAQREGTTAHRKGTMETAEDGSGLYRIVVANGFELRPWLRSFGADITLVQVLGTQSGLDYTALYLQEATQNWLEVKQLYAP